MKKIVLLFCLALTAFSVSCTSKNKAASAKVKVGSTVQKNVTIAGETVVRNLKISEYREYDQFGRVIYTKYSNTEYFEYDDKGNVIHFKNSGGHEEFYEYTFYPDGTIKTKITYEKI